ncbi:hypothetical protein [Absidia glauca]|uniref:HMG box domain-containing protein n=1 Tax=Absidia glauca TaxID=4829 RepID=A0A163THI3_ABSGL|nr:hypothetical protein [Absidia glauca]
MAKETARKSAASSKKQSGPDAPKRGLSAYMFFSQDTREKVKSENPEASFGQIGKILGAKWREMSDDDKKPYQDKAAEDKKRYEAEKEKDQEVWELSRLRQDNRRRQPSLSASAYQASYVDHTHRRQNQLQLHTYLV